MATIKSYTDLEQSKKLVKILPLESADMVIWGKDLDAIVATDAQKFMKGLKDRKMNYIPCWSLAALFDVLPGGYVIVKNYHSFYYVESRDHSKSTNIFDNPVDACVAMIEKLHKLNLL